MKGSSHLLIGAAAGAVIGFQTNSDPLTIPVCTAAGAVSALVPDLDTNGLASNRITLSKKISVFLMQFAGISLLLTIFYLLYANGFSMQIAIYSAIGLLLLVISRFIKQRHMLTLTGVVVISIGVVMEQSAGILLAGGYIVIASFLPHRSYTHSLLGAACFGFILHMILQQWPFDGVLAAGVAGYISHLIADMKCLPMNRRGVKWFMPLWKKEF